MMVKSDNTAFYAEQNALMPLDDLMARDNLKKEWFYPGELLRGRSAARPTACRT